MPVSLFHEFFIHRKQSGCKRIWVGDGGLIFSDNPTENRPVTHQPENVVGTGESYGLPNLI